MLQLRPGCENCARPLPPASREAMICSYECTFCRTCVETVLDNVCPNCGGGFQLRPVRPAQDRQGGNWLGAHPASDTIVHHPVDFDAQAERIARLGSIPPEQR